MRTSRLVVTVVTLTISFVALHAQTSKLNDPLAGAWTLNKSASDLGEPGGAGDGREGGQDDGRRGFGGRRGGVSGSGFGRGGQSGQKDDREAMQRMRDALQQEMTAPDHMTIVASGSTIIITTPDGHTTRLATEGEKIKDEATGIERRSKWGGGTLVSEISGLGRGKITETYSAVGEPKQLRVTLSVDGPRKTTQTRVYDLDSK